jgi:polyribonucleotide nucleotidyltransferase
MQCWLVFSGAVRIGDVDGELIINPTKQELQQSSLNLVVASTQHRVGRNFIKITLIMVKAKFFN